MVDKKKQKNVIKIVEKLEETKDKKKLLRELDNYVYKLYGINKTERMLIEDSLKKMMSEKSLW